MSSILGGKGMGFGIDTEWVGVGFPQQIPLGSGNIDVSSAPV